MQPNRNPIGIMARLVRPKAENTLERLIIDTYGGMSTSSGQTVTADKAMRIGAVYACVLVLSQSVAQLPLHFFRRVGKDKERVTDHSLSGLTGVQPNEWMSAFEFKQLAMIHQLLRGNSYWLKTRGIGDKVRELIPINPDRVVGIDQDSLYRLSYRVRRPDNTVDTIPGESILHFKGLSFDGIRGLNPIEYAREMLGLAIATEKHGAKMFSQGTTLGGVLSHPGLLTDEASKRMRNSFEEVYSGVENAHRTAVLEEGTKWEKISMTAEDSQFLESRQYGRSEIAGFFRVPAHFINDLTHATFTNIEHLDIAFVKHSLMPWLVSMEQTMQKSLLTTEEKTDYYFKFNVDGMLRGDSVSRGNYYNQAIMGGWMNPNEVRELEERNAYDKGDEFRIPANMIPVGAEEKIEAIRQLLQS